MWYKVIFFGLPFLLVFITIVLIDVRIDYSSEYKLKDMLPSVAFGLHFGFGLGAIFYLVSTLLFMLVSPYHYTEATSGILYVLEQKTYSKENKLLYFIETVNGDTIVPTSYNPSDVGKKVEVLVREKWIIDQQLDVHIEAKLSEVN